MRQGKLPLLSQETDHRLVCTTSLFFLSSYSAEKEPGEDTSTLLPPSALALSIDRLLEGQQAAVDEQEGHNTHAQHAQSDKAFRG